ncbi:MAG TPA: FAD-dependent oxidoreductase [Candidatus Acidoferrales bacterium]|nr:FAD-dependent oxidoreductase [Candidatus Acidoferrales bacterium]
MNNPAEVVIVGAGIVGAACASELAAEGLRVVVIDEGFPGRGSTGAAMGHIVVMDDSEAQFAITRYSQILWDDMRDQLTCAVEFDPCGTLWVATDENQMAEVRRKFDYYRERGVNVEILDSQQVRDAEPHLRAPLAGGLRVPGDSVIYPPCATGFLLQRARHLGARVIYGQPVTAIGKGIARLADGTIFAAGFIINAAGQSAPQLSAGINIKPRKGHLVITDRYPNFLHHQVVELGYLKSAHSLTADSVAFNVQPRKTGQILIGSSRQYGADNSAVDHSILVRMLQRAFEYMPDLNLLSAIRVWTGFRPATPDKLPLIGPSPEDPSVLVAAGHEGLGITTSLATAKLICSQILGQRPAIPIQPYLPSRQMAAEAYV